MAMPRNKFAQVLTLLRPEPCGCGGVRLGWRGSLADWWRRAFRRSQWAYMVAPVTSSKTSNRSFEVRRSWRQGEEHPPPKWTIQEQHAPTQREVSRYHVYRLSLQDGINYVGDQCAVCGAWADVDIKADDRTRKSEGLQAGYRREFQSARSADEYARRLQNGVPQNWELVTAIMAAIGGGVVAILIEAIELIIRSLQTGGSP